MGELLQAQHYLEQFLEGQREVIWAKKHLEQFPVGFGEMIQAQNYLEHSFLKLGGTDLGTTLSGTVPGRPEGSDLGTKYLEQFWVGLGELILAQKYLE